MKTIFVLLILSIFSLVFPSMGFSQTWKAKASYETLVTTNTRKKIKVAVITFTKDGVKIGQYKPTEAPFGFIKQEQISLGDKTFLLTSWGLGARSLLFRVFDPLKSLKAPLCEVSTDSEKVDLRLSEQTLQVQTEISTLGKKSKKSWQNCPL